MHKTAFYLISQFIGSNPNTIETKGRVCLCFRIIGIRHWGLGGTASAAKFWNPAKAGQVLASRCGVTSFGISLFGISPFRHFILL